MAENQKLKPEIQKLEASARRTAAWADKVERSKIGFNPIEEHDRFLDTRGYIGEKSRRMQQRRKNLENRQNKAIDEKSRLLRNIDEAGDLKLTFLQHHKEVYIRMTDFQVYYKDRENNDAAIAVPATPFHMDLKRSERLVLSGKNGCGKSSIIKSILLCEDSMVLGGIPEDMACEPFKVSGNLELAKAENILYAKIRNF